MNILEKGNNTLGIFKEREITHSDMINNKFNWLKKGSQPSNNVGRFLMLI